jgi:hypothetical protein
MPKIHRALETPLIIPDADIVSLDVAFAIQVLAKLDELAEHFGIPEFEHPLERHFLVLVRLASVAYVGFRFPKRKVGRPSIRGLDGAVELIFRVRLCCAVEETSIVGACTILSKREKYRNLTPQTLRSQYYASLRKVRADDLKIVDDLVYETVSKKV